MKSLSILLLPLLALILAQLIKVVIELKERNFSWQVLKKYGGFPSSHSALVFSLATEIAYVDGFYSPAFAVALVLLILTVRDATGFRRDLDHHAIIINKIVDKLPDKKQLDLPYLQEKIGHTPLQIVAGGVIGILTVLIGNFLI